MIRDRIIICIASSWDYDPTSKHHIMQTLSNGNHIVWVDYHGTRRPAISKADFKAGCHVLRRFARGVRRVSPSILQVTPLVIPGVASRPLRWLHQRMLIAQIRRAIRFVPNWQDRAIQVWTFAPDVPFLAGQFDEEGFIYYCVDEHSLFEGFDEKRILAAESETIRRADVVVAASEPLLQAKRALRADVALVRHGVQFDHFATAWRSPPPPPHDIASIPRPILGFFGLIQFWVDCKLIAELARLRPQYSIVLIGDCVSDVSELRRWPNIHLLGRRPFEQLPDYCAHFDAGLMPFVQSPLTEMVNPIKMYEYLAAGLPVVSTPLPEAQRFLGPLEIADTAPEFARACDRALESNYDGRRESISRVVQHESWLSKVEQLSRLVMDRLHPAERARSVPVSEVMAPKASPGKGLTASATVRRASPTRVGGRTTEG